MCTTLGECLIQEMQQTDGENPIQHSERAHIFSKSIPTGCLHFVHVALHSQSAN